MSVIELKQLHPSVYVILGIDAHEHDQVLAVCTSFDKAKNYLTQFLSQTEFFDLWIEEHKVL